MSEAISGNVCAVEIVRGRRGGVLECVLEHVFLVPTRALGTDRQTAFALRIIQASIGSPVRCTADQQVIGFPNFRITRADPNNLAAHINLI